MESYEVFVQWERGKSHQHAQTITAPDDETALMLAKRNVDLRLEPIDLWVVPQSAITRTDPEDTALTPATDREYRNVTGYTFRPTEEAK
ncbi:MAG: 1,2-phenylacetyl-CoA epoxidase subunit PaaB [Halobacteriota archaeon]